MQKLNPFKRTTVSDILAKFEKTVKQLDDLISSNDRKVNKNNVKVAELASESKVLETDSRRAQTVRGKISQLIAAE